MNSVTAKIKLIGLRFFAYHGLYDFEKEKGNHFIVNVVIEKTFENIAVYELSDTVDYEIVFKIIAKQMLIPHELLENLVQQIIYEIETTFLNLKKINIEIQKQNPPIKGADINYSAVEFEKVYE